MFNFQKIKDNVPPQFQKPVEKLEKEMKKKMNKFSDKFHLNKTQ